MRTERGVRILMLSGLLLASSLSCAQRSGTPGQSRETGASMPGVAAVTQFRDVTDKAGIDFRHFNGATGHKYYPETFGSGAAFLDYDGDGWQDIFLVNGCALPGQKAIAPCGEVTQKLYRNNHDGTFSDVTRPAGLAVTFYGMGCAVADFDNDGDEDLYVTAALGKSHLFRNERLSSGKALFVDVTETAGVDNEGEWGTSCAWLDYDQDGFLDLFVGNYVTYDLERDIQCMNAGRKAYCGPLVYDAAACRLYRNEQHGTFRDVTRSAGISKRTGKSLGVAVWDFDEDGLPDIVVANDLSPNYLFHNLGKGRFEEVGVAWGLAYAEEGTARSGMGIDVADYRHDGHAGVFISNFAREPNSLFRFEGNRLFSDQTYASGMGEVSLLALGFGLFFFDYDNDGWRDAFVTNGHVEPDIERFESPVTFAQRPFLFHNEQDGTFQEVGARSGEGLQRRTVGRGAAWGDYDNDGDLDILVNNNNQRAQLLRNESGGAGHWLELRLVGQRSNRDGLGATVSVSAGGLVQRDQARSGSSYLSRSDPRLHFGLGRHASPVEIAVRWPAGTEDTLRGVAVDQRLTIVEGRGIVPKR